MRWFYLVLMVCLWGGAGCSPRDDTIAIRWHSGFTPNPVSEQWRASSDGRLAFIRESAASHHPAAKRQIIRANVRISPRQFYHLVGVLEPVRKGVLKPQTAPCGPPDGGSISVQREGPHGTWRWTSAACDPQRATTMMQAAGEAMVLLRRWTAQAAQ